MHVQQTLQSVLVEEMHTISNHSIRHNVKHPLSRFSTYMMNSSHTQAQTQEKEAEKEAEANKRHRTRSSSAHVSLSSGIPQRSLSSWAKSIQKTPSKKYPLAGKIRTPKRSRLSDSSSDAVSTPEDFHINTGLEMLCYLFIFNTLQSFFCD